MTSPLSLLLIGAVTVNTAASHALLKRGLGGAGMPAHVSDAARLVVRCVGSPFVWGSLSLQVIGYALWIVVIARERLAVATAISGSFFYILMAGLGWIFFSERLSLPQLAGLALISVGVGLMATT